MFTQTLIHARIFIVWLAMAFGWLLVTVDVPTVLPAINKRTKVVSLRPFLYPIVSAVSYSSRGRIGGGPRGIVLVRSAPTPTGSCAPGPGCEWTSEEP